MKQRKQAKLHGSNRHEKDKRERAGSAVGLHSGLSGGKKKYVLSLWYDFPP
jgi:hypothetical protein